MTRWKPAVGLASSSIVADEVVEFGVDEVDDGALELVESTLQARMTAAASLIVDQRQQQMLERRIFMVRSLARSAPDAAPFRGLGERGHFSSSLLFHHALQRMLVLRAKSMTCVTLVSATS
jgi:hypothetical protein